MKLLRHGEFGNEKPGILDQNGSIRDLSGHLSDINGETCLLYTSPSPRD